jgi:hypothetical protein
LFMLSIEKAIDKGLKKFATSKKSF